MRLPLLFATLVALQPFGCGTRLSAEEAQRLLLKHQQVKRHTRVFYVGLASAATMDSATGAAFAEITRQLTWLPKSGRHMLEGLYRVDRALSDRDGQVHVLAVLERQAAADHLATVVRKRRAKLAGTLQGCSRRLKRGELKQARRCMEPVKGELSQIGELTAGAQAAVGDSPRRAEIPEERLAKELGAQLAAADSRSKVMLVRVLRVIDGQPAGNLDVRFGRVVTTGGYQVVDGRITHHQIEAVLARGGGARAVAEAARTAGAGYAVVGQITARFSSEEGGQYFAWARGQLRVIETAAGKIVGELSHEQIKGGHVSRKQACERAVDNAATALQAVLKAKLAELN